MSQTCDQLRTLTDTDTQCSSEHIESGEMLECLSHNQLSKEESVRHYVIAKLGSSSFT
jgi:hypothetical protein